MRRDELLGELARRIARLRLGHPVRVAVDGVDAAGKTTLADELAPLVQAQGRPVIRASIDGFHRPRIERYRRGAHSPAGYYHDAFDYAALHAALLEPLGPGGSRRYRRATFDYRADRPAPASEEVAPEDAALLFDGVFLLRPELAARWDYRVFVAVPFEVALQRALTRDAELFGSVEATRERYLRRYVPGQRLYLATRPDERADAIVWNADPTHPALLLRDV